MPVKIGAFITLALHRIAQTTGSRLTCCSVQKMMTMDLYRFDRNLRIVGQGQCDCDAALATFEQCYGNGFASYDSGEDAMAATSFGLSRSQTDFIEISCHGQNSVTVHSDRLCYPSRLSKTFSLKHHFFIKGDKTKGVEIIRDYFNMERQAFEAKYAYFLCR